MCPLRSPDSRPGGSAAGADSRCSSGACASRYGWPSSAAADGRSAASCVSIARTKSAHAGEMLGGSGRMRCSVIARLMSAFSRPSNGRWPARGHGNLSLAGPPRAQPRAAPRTASRNSETAASVLMLRAAALRPGYETRAAQPAQAC